METLKTDILILGTGGAGLFAALHALKADPDLNIAVAAKGLLGKCGCTRMVQGGYNAALIPGDSIERHFMDSLIGGSWLPNQDLAWLLVNEAPKRILELENEAGCFFDRNPDGTLHGKAFAGQTFDRTIHKGDLTGIEIINRLAEQVWARNVRRLEECRAVGLIPASDGSLAGVLMVDMRTGDFVWVQAKAVLLATGGGPTMYRYHTPSGDKACDGMAMALRAGLPLRDMEMVQFHPTGLLAGEGTRLTGTVLEEGLRGAGGYLLGGDGERFMLKYDERGERATRDIVSQSIYSEIRSGNCTEDGGVFIEMSHLGPDNVRRMFKGMVERCADVGLDLAGGPVPVVPTAHYMMGGIEIGLDCSTALPGLYVAGEDTGGVHGSNRLGGNGVADSTVFGGVAGGAMAPFARGRNAHAEPDRALLDEARARCLSPYEKPAGDLAGMLTRLSNLMWDKAGITRDKAGLQDALAGLEDLTGELAQTGVPKSTRAFDLNWHQWLNLENMILTSRAIAASALSRESSQGSHHRSDFPDKGDPKDAAFVSVRLDSDKLALKTTPVDFTRVRPGDTLPETPIGETGETAT
ncbi:MAG: FAD-binding protein [Rhodospirillales bacterium]|nr:FAD-binding protein [Rhodospirillales bacterium]